ncbi:hypothetical protein ACFLZ2_05785 [Candidatus Margulisiibacteriota bacterium]
MKRFLPLILVIFLSSTSFALDADVTTSTIFDAGMYDTVDMTSQVKGDLWLKLSGEEHWSADFDYQFGRDVSKINVAQLKLFIPETDIVLGRQQIGWGVGYAFNPIDIINPKPVGSSFDPTFVRDGRDAVTITKYFGELNKLELVYAGQLTETKMDSTTPVDVNFQEDVGLKFKSNIDDFDVAAIYVDKGLRTYNGSPEAKDGVLGFEVSGTLPVIEWGFWTETAHYLETNKYEYVIGTDYYFGDYHATFEYYKNGFGSVYTSSYDPALMLQGRLMGQDYISSSGSYVFDEKLTVTKFSFWNLNDGGMMSGAVVDYFLNDNVELILMPIFLTGSDYSEFGQQASLIGSYAVQAMVKCVY